jgi:hypothetical protein
MELLALQVEAEVEAENDITDDSTEIMAVDAAAARTESEVLFAQMEAKVEAEVAAELLQQHAAAATAEEDEEDGVYLTVMVPEGSGPGDELVLQVRLAVSVERSQWTHVTLTSCAAICPG